MPKLVLITILLHLIIWKALPQDNYYANPVKIPILLSGNFGELRSDHFHSGIDIKTKGETGIPVHSVADGFISRISVSPAGFGKALYITHPNGTTTVYGHLEKFTSKVQKYITDLQYRKRSFRIDQQLSSSIFPVKKNDLIGYSGNSGSSGGPHLHFEIRDSRSSKPINPLKYDFSVADNTPPKIFALMITPLDPYSHVEYSEAKKIYPVILNGDTYIIRKSVIPVYGNIGFAIRTNDFFDQSENICGVYSIELKVDGEPYYSFKMDEFSFDETRYLNSHIDYEEYILSGKRFHKTWLDPGNKLSIYSYVRNKGIFKVNDGNPHPVSIEIKDIHGNKAVIKFSIVSRVGNIQANGNEYGQHINFNKQAWYRNDSISINFPANTFYKDFKFTYRKAPGKLLSGIHIIHNKTVPLHKSAVISIQPGNVNDKIHEKLLLVNVDTITGRLSSAGGSYKNGWVTSNIRSFGNYAVAADTIPPKIVPLSISNQTILTEASRLRFLISDELSGISSVEGYLDGKWILFDYDAKNNLIVHTFDTERFEMGKKHQLKLYVTDLKSNKSVYEASFYK
ncbi:MAG: M23 family metallopeptidase [Bacteroidales bacterium]|nr:M23 family metallopeptidase [Bacteroidales bacterium]